MATESRRAAQIDQAAIDRTVAGLKSRNVDAVVAESGDEARQILIDMIPDGAEVFKSTSETLDTIGYSDYIRETDRYRNLYLEIAEEPDRDRQRELRRLASVAEFYVGSVHAIAETGEVIVASGSGSQLGAYVYGAKTVIWVAGVQKICPSLDDALARVKGLFSGTAPRMGHSPGTVGRPAGQADDLRERAESRPHQDGADQGIPGLVSAPILPLALKLYSPLSQRQKGLAIGLCQPLFDRRQCLNYHNRNRRRRDPIARCKEFANGNHPGKAL